MAKNQIYIRYQSTKKKFENTFFEVHFQRKNLLIAFSFLFHEIKTQRYIILHLLFSLILFSFYFLFSFFIHFSLNNDFEI